MSWTMPAAYGPTDAFGDRGWLAIALVIFTIWRPGKLPCYFCIYFLWRPVHPLPVHSHRYGSYGIPGTVQDDPLCGYLGGAGAHQYAETSGRISRPALLDSLISGKNDKNEIFDTAESVFYTGSAVFLYKSEEFVYNKARTERKKEDFLMTKKIWTVLLAAGATAVWAGPSSVAAQETETLTEYTMETLHVASEETEHSKETELLEETEFSEKAELSEEQRQEYVSAYRDALETFLQDQMLPDKTTQWSLVEGMGEMEENSFAISDVDSDGVPELVLHLVTAPMAGILEGVYQYDPQTKELKEELLGFPSAEYYEGGLLKMWWA